jgi:hypothetical protein
MCTRLSLMHAKGRPDAGAPAQVKLMGDFDGWSRGVDLAAEDTTGDSVFTRFTATLLLPKVTGSPTGSCLHEYAPTCNLLWSVFGDRLWPTSH